MMRQRGFLRCESCEEWIEDDEYVVNWGTCNSCFDQGYAEYLAEEERTRRLRRGSYYAEDDDENEDEDDR